MSRNPALHGEPGPAVRPCVRCFVAWGLLLAAVGGSFAYLQLPLGELFSRRAAGDLARFGAAFFPPDTTPAFLQAVGRATVETLAISALGTLLAAVVGLLVALPAAGRFGAAPRAIARLGLNALRSVPELVWATLLVLAAGLGPFAGTLALAAHTTGVLGRLFAETLENAPDAPRAALELAGVPPPVAFCYGTWPLILPQAAAYTLYRWEMNIRMAAILGFVGAGGLGQLLYYEFSLFHEARASTVILAMLALTLLVDAASAGARRRLETSAG